MTFQVEVTEDGSAMIDDDVMIDMPYKPERMAFAEQLKSRPGIMAILARVPASRVQMLRQRGHDIRYAHNRQKMFAPAGHFEVEVRVIFDSAFLFVRYVGDGSAALGEPSTTDEVARQKEQAAAQTRIHLLITWYGREIFWEERRLAPDRERIAELKFKQRICMRDREELAQMDAEATRRIGQIYDKRLRQALGDDTQPTTTDDE